MCLTDEEKLNSTIADGANRTTKIHNKIRISLLTEESSNLAYVKPFIT